MSQDNEGETLKGSLKSCSHTGGKGTSDLTANVTSEAERLDILGYAGIAHACHFESPFLPFYQVCCCGGR